MRRAAIFLQYYNQGGVAVSPGGHKLQEPSTASNSAKKMKPRPQKRFMDPSSFIETPPVNTILNIVPQGHEHIVERLGRYHCTLKPGWWFVIPIIDKIRYNYNVKEQGIDIPNQSAITCDNVVVDIDGVLFLKIVDSKKASYNIENPIYNLINLAQTTMRSEIGRMTLDDLLHERATLNANIVGTLRREAHEWGIECKRYEIKDIIVSELVRQSMDLQAEAERQKRKFVLESEGEAAAEANRAAGLKTAQQLAADAQKYTILKGAEAEAEAIRLKAEAMSDNIAIISKAIEGTKHSNDVISLHVAQKYIEKFGELAKETNTVVLSQPISDPSAFTTQALSIFNAVATSASKSTPTTKL